MSPSTGTVKEGGEIELTLMIDRNPANTTVSSTEKREYTNEEVTVMLTMGAGSTAGASDYSTMSVKFPARTRGLYTAEMKVKVMALADDEIEDGEMLVLDAMLAGSKTEFGSEKTSHAGVATLTIEEDTDKLVWAKAVDVIYAAVEAAIGEDKSLNANETAEIMGSALFNAAEGVSLSFTAESDNMDVVSVPVASGTVMLEAGDMAGMAAITVTAHASMPSGVTIATQTDPDEASVTFPVSVVLADLSVTVAADPVEIMEGGISTITASANRAVVEDTTIALDVISSDGNDDHQLEITIEAGMMSGSVELEAATDDDYMDSSYTLLASGPGIDGSVRLLVTVIDSDEAPVDEPTVSEKSQELVDLVFATAIADARTGSEWTAGGADAMVDMSELFDVADGASPAYSGVSSDEMVVEASSSGMMLSLTPAAEGMATITVTASDSASGDVATASSDVTVAELPLSVTVSASAAMVAEGGSITLTAMANKMVDAATPVVVTRDGASQAGADDYTVGEFMIAAGEMTGTAMLMATDDDDVEGNESLTLNAMVGDMSAGMVMVTIEDNDVETTYTLSASAEMVMEGGEVTITATASQMVRANTEVMVMRDGSSSAGDDDYSLVPVLITIMTGDTSGIATLTATDDSDVEGDETLTLNGMVGDMNAGSVMLTVTDNDMEITYTLSGPMDVNIAEGMSAELTATASSAVPMDTEVMVMRDGTSTAGADDFTAAPIMIMTGDTMGTTMVMAVEDNMAEEMEMLTLYGMVDDMSTNSVSFNLWDAAVPALPLIAQLLLAAFLAIGGYRRYLRR